MTATATETKRVAYYKGCLASLSAKELDSATQALARFSSCVVQSGVELPYQAVRYQIADAINLVLHLERRHGVRTVIELLRIGRYEAHDDRFESEAVFSASTVEPVADLAATGGVV